MHGSNFGFEGGREIRDVRSSGFDISPVLYIHIVDGGEVVHVGKVHVDFHDLFQA